MWQLDLPRGEYTVKVVPPTQKFRLNGKVEGISPGECIFAEKHIYCLQEDLDHLYETRGTLH